MVTFHCRCDEIRVLPLLPVLFNSWSFSNYSCSKSWMIAEMVGKWHSVGSAQGWNLSCGLETVVTYKWGLFDGSIALIFLSVYSSPLVASVNSLHTDSSSGLMTARHWWRRTRKTCPIVACGREQPAWPLHVGGQRLRQCSWLAVWELRRPNE